jgi:hypothetical protein
MGVDNHEGSIGAELGQHMQQDGVLHEIGEIAGVKGVAIVQRRNSREKAGRPARGLGTVECEANIRLPG